MSDDNGLKRCPFCGGPARSRAMHIGEGLTETWVECRHCFAQTDPMEAAYAEHEAAARMWNQRAPTPGDTHE